MKPSDIIRFSTLLLAILTSSTVTVEGCTSAIVGARRSTSGHTLLWKHRDTGAKANYVSRHPATDSTFEYIALHNDTDPEGLEAWMGMNMAGFAVMNTASYNLAPDTATVKDMEGILMTVALRHCVTVDDFATLLDSLPRPIGVQANFGAIDSRGNAAYFETNDIGYTRYDVPDTAIIVRTNYSHAGCASRRLGLARERTARRYLDSRPHVSPCEIIDSLSRPFRDIETGAIIPADKLCGVEASTGDYIPRTISTSSIVIEALSSPSGDGSRYTMWTVLGYPPDGEIEAITWNNVHTLTTNH